ncbi:2-amino-4-hydroxy-6-hydroxymethyldihydropteridine pyrophosphokinase [Gloeothece citriformis PCC 7424]|uniref:2-amino-4-hydroxy-6-hydroxymethyldihydropteridine diphosphokinase n=1 Tax=Gloeothece citriformis (strain PCC 7424) TaxID=65393 RepID=B7K861_GLOC7|nr:2-amino-4-hydroxy-6-hydroxymethyldihydropteridine diphosphokinase [Gloeothece citriformis]ACK68549.1 2-amino-4-hydroxy-6-hydroxymethyldihydropteridine pyrophosphokinase [Gloeothece citriformis PCC 7424]
MTPAAIALGSNLGESVFILENALSKLAQTPKITIVSRSHWYNTTAVGPPQPDYVNGCAILNVDWSPERLIDILLEIEQDFGRMRREKWGPRTLDLDLLFYDNLILNTPKLQLPHPRMRERAFVLIPLAEIATDWIDPVTGKSIVDLLKAVDPSGVKLIH